MTTIIKQVGTRVHVVSQGRRGPAGADGSAVTSADIATALGYTPAQSSHTHALSSLTQSGATTGQVPRWSGTAWTPATISGGGGDVTAAGANVFTGLNKFTGGLWSDLGNDNGVTIGNGAGQATPTSDSVRIGFFANGNATTPSVSSVYVGRHAGALAIGDNATILGHAAGQYAYSSGSAVLIGYEAARNPTQNASALHFSSVLIGHLAAQNGVSNQTSVIIGSNAGTNATTNIGAVMLGYGAGRGATTSSGAVMIGTDAGNSSTSAVNSVLIGNRAGYSLARNNSLVIESNSTYSDAGNTGLIYGEFDNRVLRFNGATTIKGAANNTNLLSVSRFTDTSPTGTFLRLRNAADDTTLFGVSIAGTVTAGTWNGAVIGSSYGGAGTANGILKANGSGTVSAASAGTDYWDTTNFTGDSGSGGVKGLVPAPAAGDAAAGRFLKADGSWSIPSGGGGGGTPGGSSTQFQYNNGGAFGGISTLTTDGTIVTFSPTVTTGSGATAGLNANANSLTTGDAFNFGSSSVTSGNVVKIAATGTAAASNTKTALNITTSGTNAASSQTTYGAQIANTSAGAGAVNVGLYVTASGGNPNDAIRTGGQIKVQPASSVNANTYLLLGGTNANAIASYSNSLGVSYQLIGDSTSSGGPAVLAFGAGGTITWQSTNRQDTGSVDLTIRRAAAATFAFGATDAAAPVAQTTQVQSVVAGTTNTAGAAWTIKGSAGTGTGAGGAINFQVAPAGSSGTAQNTFSTVLSLATSSTSRAVGFFGATPVVQQSIGAAATDAATTQALVNNIRTALINLGLCTT